MKQSANPDNEASSAQSKLLVDKKSLYEESKSAFVGPLPEIEEVPAQCLHAAIPTDSKDCTQNCL